MAILRALALGGVAIALHAAILALFAPPAGPAAAAMAVAALYGIATGWLSVYAWSPRGLGQFAVDVTWSLPNTVTGLAWLAWCLARAPMRDPPGGWQRPTALSRRHGMMHVSGVVLGPAAATTLGTVVGGRFLLHEIVHVQQARILGILYWPTYLIGFALAFVVQLATAAANAIAGRRDGESGSIDALRDAAYRRTSMEDWAFRATIEGHGFCLRLWAAWCAIGLGCAAMCAVIVAPVPVFGTLPRLAGLAAIPWWAGVLAHLLYAIVRRGFGRARVISAPPAQTT